jgi:hypothetical protein
LAYQFLLGQRNNLCAYNTKDSLIKLCDLIEARTFKSNIEAEKAIATILQPTGLVTSFTLVNCPNVDNCAAYYKDNIRYILYDKNYLTKLSKLAGEDYYVSLYVLAHEVGHHLLFHSQRKEPNDEESKMMELQADDFAGWVMCKLEASLEQAQLAINVEKDQPDCSAEEYYKHPCKERRLEAIIKGFQRCQNQKNTKPRFIAGKSNISIVNEFGGDKLGGNYCFYTCSYTNNEIFLDLANSRATYSFNYSEEGLYGCPLEVAKPQSHQIESNYFSYDSKNNSLKIVFNAPSDFFLTIIFSGGYDTDGNQAIIGEIDINRPELSNFRGYRLYIPITLLPVRKPNNRQKEYKTFVDAAIK